jgi:hypothetical protein
VLGGRIHAHAGEHEGDARRVECEVIRADLDDGRVDPQPAQVPQEARSTDQQHHRPCRHVRDE